MQDHRRLSVSIIMPTYNRAESLALTLGSLTTQKFPITDYEILVVDNASTDSTKLVTESLIRDNPHHQILYFYEPVPGLLSGRHRGAKEARGTFFVFVDDDIDADPEWLQAIVETFADSSVQLVGGRNLPRYAIRPPSWLDRFWATTPYGGRACFYLSLLDLGERMLDIDADYVWGLNFAIRRQALFDLGGFHPDVIGPDHLQYCQGDGETGLTRKANTQGYRAVYQPRALVHHRIPASRLTPGYFERRAFFQGVCDSFTAIRRSGAVTVSAPRRESLEAAGRRLVRHARYLVRHPHRFFYYRMLRRFANLKVEHIRERIQTGYQSGYESHQRAVKGNPILFEWVLRENYWDYHLPDLGVPRRANSSG